MTCRCLEKVQYRMRYLADQARSNSMDHRRRIESFQEGIRAGANEIAAHHLFRAGVYQAYLDAGLRHRPTLISIREAVSGSIAREHPELNHLIPLLLSRGADFERIDNPTQMVRNIKRRQGREIGLLRAKISNELSSCQAALDRAERLRQRLANWEAGVIAPRPPTYICITDLHGRTETIAEQ